jgi:hypothetical protein
MPCEMSHFKCFPCCSCFLSIPEGYPCMCIRPSGLKVSRLVSSSTAAPSHPNDDIWPSIGPGNDATPSPRPTPATRGRIWPDMAMIMESGQHSMSWPDLTGRVGLGHCRLVSDPMVYDVRSIAHVPMGISPSAAGGPSNSLHEHSRPPPTRMMTCKPATTIGSDIA